MNTAVALIILLCSGWPEERESNPPNFRYSCGLIIPIFEDTTLAFDVNGYRLVFDVDITAETLSAEAEISLTLLESADSLALHFSGFTVEDVEVEGQSRDFTRADSFLTVSLGATQTKDTELILKVYYHGKPQPATGGFGGGLYIDSDPDSVTFACNAPWGAKHWFPCQDNPADKATMEMIVTVPEGYEVISNGKLDSAVRTGPQWTFHWIESYPIATYLIVFAASRNYALTEDTALIDGQPLPLYHWVLVPDSAEITPKFMKVKDIVEFFSELFYPYPFADEKYAQVAVPVGGAMENQTCTHINTIYNWNLDIIVAHELSHSWWGNATTCGLLKHMWLNEGFATYCEALWIEHTEGPEGYASYYRDYIEDVYLSHSLSHNDPVLDPPWSRIYSPLTYEKPACVLHMLRRLVGDEDFFTILRTYGERYKYTSAVSEEFEAVVDEVTGDEYSWFFDQWLRAPGHPEYEWNWIARDGAVKIYLHQSQNWPPEVPIYLMPVEFGFVSGTDTSFLEFVDSLENQVFVIEVSDNPDEVLFDPHGDLLCTVKRMSDLGEAADAITSRLICPAISRGTMNYQVNAESVEDINLVLYDVSGRTIKKWDNLKPQGELNLVGLSAGVYYLKVMEPELGIHRIVVVK
ncbi:T9SS type A sorting domain-containing protein [candidate division WOR-3 bacterium]|nr:T9SS type A sorting domain-containing protein [candidate division WOR-3 bacterium]